MTSNYPTTQALTWPFLIGLAELWQLEENQLERIFSCILALLPWQWAIIIKPMKFMVNMSKKIKFDYMYRQGYLINHWSFHQ
jgi:hypothetical protein